MDFLSAVASTPVSLADSAAFRAAKHRTLLQAFSIPTDIAREKPVAKHGFMRAPTGCSCFHSVLVGRLTSADLE